MHFLEDKYKDLKNLIRDFLVISRNTDFSTIFEKSKIKCSGNLKKHQKTVISIIFKKKLPTREKFLELPQLAPYVIKKTKILKILAESLHYTQHRCAFVGELEFLREQIKLPYKDRKIIDYQNYVDTLFLESQTNQV